MIDDDYGFATKPDRKWGPVRMTMAVLFIVIAGGVPPITLALTAHEVIPTVEKLIDLFGG